MDIQQVERMRHLWKDARAKYTSFFACLSEVRREIGDEALEVWCRKELMIGLIAINKAAGLLRDVDADRTKVELSEVARAAKEKRELEAHNRRMEVLERKNAILAKKLEGADHRAAKKAAEEARAAAKIAAEKKEQRKVLAAIDGDGIQRARRFWENNPDATHQQCEKATGVAHGHSVSARRALVDQKVIPSPKKEAGHAAYDSLDDVDKFKWCVREGLAAAKHQWTLGDLALKISGLRVYGNSTLEHFAMQIDVEYSTLRAYLAVARAWPEIAIRPAYSLAQILAAHPHRISIHHDNKNMTVDDAREIMRAYKATTNVVPIKVAR